MTEFEKTYCHSAVELGEPHLSYHNTIYGFPAKDDNELFQRLMLEVNQAGLSWSTILKKKQGLLLAYNNFDIEIVANYTEKDRERLLSDARIIRNKLKVNAAIYNANSILSIQKEHTSFMNWLKINSPKQIEDWVKLFKKKFKFTGGEITKEFLMGTGFFAGAHHPNCSIYDKVLAQKPYWVEIEK